MFRIKFNARTSAWQVQLLCFGFVWVTIDTPRLADLHDAQDFCKQTGLTEHYREQKPFNHVPATYVETTELK
jgi:hypothetical protein